MTTCSLALVLVSAIGFAPAKSAGTPIGQRLVPTAKEVAAKAGDKQILLVVVEDSRSEPESWLLVGEIRDQLALKLEYARDHLGQQVGNGECWTLAAEALKQSGAKRDGALGFGRKLGKRDPILPGDILQFEKATFKGKNRTQTMPHHTAIVYAVQGPTVFTIAQQNTGGPDGKKASLATIDSREMVEGTVEAFRPRTSASPEALER
jgi:hypothetical protein